MNSKSRNTSPVSLSNNCGERASTRSLETVNSLVERRDRHERKLDNRPFSRPSARIQFSQTAIISRRPNGTPCLQFRIANQRRNILIDLQARVLLKTVEPGTNDQTYAFLPLERDSISFFPLSWTLVHDITAESPLHNLVAEDYAQREVEIIIQLKGYDDTFAQDVHARNSYTHDEIEWHRRFIRAYEVGEDGIAVVDLDQLHLTEVIGK